MVTSSSLSLRRLSSGLTGCEVHARTARRGRPANATQSARRGAAVRAQAKKDDGKDNEGAASNKNSNGATNKDGKKEGRETEYIDTLEAYYSMVSQSTDRHAHPKPPRPSPPPKNKEDEERADPPTEPTHVG